MRTTASAAPREPIASALTRNLAIAAGVGTAIALARREPALLIPNAALALWFSLGGHYVEVAFLEHVRPRLAHAWLACAAARIGSWFAGGVLLYLLMALTARGLPVARLPWGWWWLGGLSFIAVELLVHALLALRHRPNFYGGDG